MNSSNFNQWNKLFGTSTKKAKLYNDFGFVPNCDVEYIFYSDFLSWERNDVTAKQFYFHEYGHIIHNRMAHVGYGGWSIEKKEDNFGEFEKVVNKQLKRWFIEKDFYQYRSNLPRDYNQYIKDHREYWAETFSIFLHKVMGWPLKEGQETFYTLCIEGHLSTCPIWKILWDAVEVTALKLKEKG